MGQGGGGGKDPAGMNLWGRRRVRRDSVKVK